MTNTEYVPINHKLTLTISEAVAYSSIGQNRIENLLKQPDCPFVLHVGTGKRLVKRKEFEEYISRVVSV